MKKHYASSNMTVWRPEGSDGGYLVRSYPGSLTYVTLEGLDIRSRKDSVNYLNWSQSRWLSVISDAVYLRGTNNVVRNNTITGVGQGIAVSENSLVEGNVIDGFAWDGCEGISNSIFRNNLVMNCFKVDSTHRDGFQSYSKSTVTNLTVEGNIILVWTHKTSSSLRGSMQGISLFDGYYDDLVIRNNVVASDHYNGITVLGTRRATITNNTVVNIDGTSGKAPWIKIDTTKAGSPSKDVLVANNLANSLSGGDAKNNVVFTNNSALLYPTKVLQNIAGFDYRPKADSGFIDKANREVCTEDGCADRRPSLWRRARHGSVRGGQHHQDCLAYPACHSAIHRGSIRIWPGSLLPGRQKDGPCL